MADITLFLDSYQGAVSADFQFIGDDLATGHDLETAVSISLFSDAVASDDYVLQDGNPHGWWAGPIGSRLWQFYRSTKTSETRVNIIDAVRECLDWLITDGIASSIDIDALFIQNSGNVKITIDIHRPSAADVNLAYDWAWSNP